MNLTAKYKDGGHRGDAGQFMAEKKQAGALYLQTVTFTMKIHLEISKDQKKVCEPLLYCTVCEEHAQCLHQL